MDQDKSHICIKCGEVMNKCDRPQQYSKVWDLGITGSGVTTTTTTSGSRHEDLNASRIPAAVDTQKVELILYQCPNCEHKDSFPE